MADYKDKQHQIGLPIGLTIVNQLNSLCQAKNRVVRKAEVRDKNFLSRDWL